MSGFLVLSEAIDYDGLECPDNSPVGCAASVAGPLTQLWTTEVCRVTVLLPRGFKYLNMEYLSFLY